MALSQKLIAKLSKHYAPQTRIDEAFRGKDMTFITNDRGEPVLLFIGTRQADGTIRGERYARRIVRGSDGSLMKSHWDNKGKV